MELLTRAGLIAGVLMLISTALAQVPPGEFGWEMLPFLGENPVFLALAIVGLVKMIRKSQPWLDGAVLVPAFAAALGAAIGAALQFGQQLVALPFADWSFPVGGIVYGAMCGILGTTGLNLFEAFASAWNRNRADASTLALVATGQPVNAGAWVVQHARSLVPQNRVTPALEVLAPLIGSVANQMLTDELRADLQAKIHRTLKDAGLLRGRDFGEQA